VVIFRSLIFEVFVHRKHATRAFAAMTSAQNGLAREFATSARQDRHGSRNSAPCVQRQTAPSLGEPARNRVAKRSGTPNTADTSLPVGLSICKQISRLQNPSHLQNPLRT